MSYGGNVVVVSLVKVVEVVGYIVDDKLEPERHYKLAVDDKRRVGKLVDRRQQVVEEE